MSEIASILSFVKNTAWADTGNTFVNSNITTFATTGTRAELSTWLANPDRTKWFVTCYMQRQEPPKCVYRGVQKFRMVVNLDIYAMITPDPSDLATLIATRQSLANFLVTYIKNNDQAISGVDMCHPNKPEMFDLPDTFLKATIPLHVELIQ